MPAWEKVNDVKTPIAYSGISLVTLASKATTSKAAKNERTTIPFEKTRRSPYRVSCLGMNRSRAMKLESRGKP
jgi:hypothetical protein